MVNSHGTDIPQMDLVEQKHMRNTEKLQTAPASTDRTYGNGLFNAKGCLIRFVLFTCNL